MSFVTSPVLYATPFVGKDRPHKIQEGALWLHCADFGFSFCCAEIDESFGTIIPGDIVRLEVSLEKLHHMVAYPLFAAACISECSEAMLSELFQAEYGTGEFDSAVAGAFGLHDDWAEGLIDFDDGYPERMKIFYRVRRV